MLNKKSFTLIELLVVIIIIGILAALALPGFEKSKEKALDKEAKSMLTLIQAAEKIYNMEGGFYYPPAGGSESSISNINTYLKLSIPTSSSWSYKVDSGVNKATATRTTGTRYWQLLYTDEEASCPAPCNY